MSVFNKGDQVMIRGYDNFRDMTELERARCRKFIGRVGRIVEVKTGGPAAVGNTPHDPLYVVDVPVLGKDGFWEEELEKLGG